jgi:hypothetical protein
MENQAVTIGRIRNVRGIQDAYSRRILSNLIGRDPLSVYSSTPAGIRNLLRGLTPAQLRKRPAGNRWSIAELVCHFCDAEWAMGFRIRKAIAEPGSPLQAYDQNKWAARLHYGEMDCRARLRLFTELRQSHLALIRLLSKSELRRYGIHQERGKETVERMIHMLAGHDVNHLLQITALRKRWKNGRP